MKNSNQIEKIKASLYLAWLRDDNKYFTGNDAKSPIMRMIGNFKKVKGVKNVTIKNSAMKQIEDFDGDIAKFKEFNLIVQTAYGDNIIGVLRCCNIANGSFALVVSFKEAGQKMNESFDFDFKFGSFIKALRKAKTLGEIKQVAKQYIKEGVALGAVLTAIICNFSLSEPQYQDIAAETAKAQVEDISKYVKDTTVFGMYNDDDVAIDDTPKWKKICSDAEGTVYNAVKSQCNSDPKHTASGFELNLKHPGAHKIVAMERTMMAQYGLQYGDLIKIVGAGERDGVYQIQDTMSKKYKGRHKIDFLVNNDIHLGKWEGLTIYKLENPGVCYHDLTNIMLPAVNQDYIRKKQKDVINKF